MRMSEGVEWAVHACTVLAALPDGETMPSARLAEFHDVPAAYLAKHLQALAADGIVDSSPGRHGGYSLARPADEITLLDVVVAVEGRARAFRCTEIRQCGPGAVEQSAYTPLCGIAATMHEAEDAWRAVLRTRTIAGMVGDALASSPPEALVKGATWLSDVIATRRKQ